MNRTKTAYAIKCQAKPDYRLWLRFADGMEGSVYLGGLLEIGSFKMWRDVCQFENVRAVEGIPIWECGVRLDPTILYADMEVRGVTPQPITDPAFKRFMQAAMSAPTKQKKGRGHG